MKRNSRHQFPRSFFFVFCILIVSTSTFQNRETITFSFAVQAFSTTVLLSSKRTHHHRSIPFPTHNTHLPRSERSKTFAAPSSLITASSATAAVTTSTATLLARDLILLASFGWFLLPLVRQQLSRMVGQKRSRHLFRSNTGLLVLHALVQLCQVGAAVYAWDALQLLWRGHAWFPPYMCSAAGLTWWCTEQIVRVQHLLLLQSQQSTHQQLRGRRQVIDRIGQVMWRALGIYVWLDWMQIRLPTRLLAFSGTTTLVLSLAFQDLAKSFVSGLFLASSNRFYEGDGIEIDGLKGKVIKQGWMETIIRKGDEVLVSVPTIDLDKKQLSNMSRVYISQVALKLRVNYDHVGQLPKFVRDIQTELQQSCPKLITDGSRPFRVHWTDYEADCLTVAINSYYRILLGSDEYWDSRMAVLIAINRSAERNGIRFAHAGALLRDNASIISRADKEEDDSASSQDLSMHEKLLQPEELILGNEITTDD